MKTSELLKLAQVKISHPSNIVKNSLHLVERADGHEIPSFNLDDQESYRFCLLGAVLSIATPHEYYQAKDFLYRALYDVKRPRNWLANLFFPYSEKFMLTWDATPKNHAWMMKIYDKAIQLAEEEND